MKAAAAIRDSLQAFGLLIYKRWQAGWRSTRHKTPLLLPVVGFVLGLCIEKWLAIDLSTLLIAVVVVVAGYGLKLWQALHTGLPVLVVLLVLPLLVGMLRVQPETVVPPHAVRHLAGRQVTIELQISDPPMNWKHAFASFALVNRVIVGADTLPMTGKLLLTAKSAAFLQPGHRIWVGGELEAVLPDSTTTFDDYLHQQGVFVSMRRPRWLSAPIASPGIAAALQRYRMRLNDQIATHFTHPDAAALAQALTLGVKTALPREVKDQFRAAGLAHILALSGMHVGILLLMFLGLERLLIWAGLGLRQPTVFTLLFFWAYAGVAGFSPSLTRAVLMITLLAIPKLLRRDYHLLNGVLAAGLLQLLVSPELLTDLGFQFSYTAVVGIVLLAPRLNVYLQTDDAVLRYLRDALTVSLAAQLFLTPLVLVYFGQFPVYFLVANVMATALAFVATALCFGVLLTLWWPWLAGALAVVAQVLCLGMVNIAERISGWEGAVVGGLHLPLLWAVMLLAAILMLTVSLPPANQRPNRML